MEEIGIDISGQSSKSVDSIDSNQVDCVITLCAEEVCPVFFGKAEKIHWPLPDPAVPQKNSEAQLRLFREVRDEIARRIREAFGLGGN